MFKQVFSNGCDSIYLQKNSLGRILAIDYGTKRVGIAVTDPLQIIANSLTTVHSSEVIMFLTGYFLKEDVETIIVGDPNPIANEDRKMKTIIDAFVKNLTKKFPEKKMVRFDERFTSLLAKRTMIQSGIGKKARTNKGLLDKISATIILQEYLDTIKK